jgi:RNA recognition motif-containing protein
MSEEQVDVDYEDAGEDHEVQVNKVVSTANVIDSQAHESAESRRSRRIVNDQGIVENVLFLSRFNFDTSKEDIRHLLSQFGPTLDININGKIAFVDFNLNKYRLAMGVQILVHNPEDLERIRQILSKSAY